MNLVARHGGGYNYHRLVVNKERPTNGQRAHAPFLWLEHAIPPCGTNDFTQQQMMPLDMVCLMTQVSQDLLNSHLDIQILDVVSNHLIFLACI